MATVPADAVWRRSEEVAHVTSEERAALLDLRHLDRPPYLLHASAAVVWGLLDGSADTAELVRAVAEHYGVDAAEVDHDVRAFLADLAELQLVEPASVEPASVEPVVTTVPVDALGVTVTIEADDTSTAAALRQAWSACLAPPGSVPRVSVRGRGVTLAETLETATQQVTVAAVGERAGELLMLHACALADEATRRSVVLVGPSGVGKSTLSRTLGGRFTYLSDETAAVDEAGRVLAYAKPLSLRDPDEPPGPGKRQRAPGELGLRAGQGWYDVAAVVLLSRTASPEPVVTDVRTVPAVALLAEHTSYLASLERPLTRLADLLHRAGGLRLVEYAEAADLAPLMQEWLA